MGVLAGMEPEGVFRFFEEIAGIPHGSGNVGQISDYLVQFARERNLFCAQDDLKNVIIIKEASRGYEAEPPVILQGHMDMVAVKKPDCDVDLKTQGLRLAVEGDKLYAEGTSLGGDDGIAVAYCLALLDSHSIRHPRLEVVITVDEEVGMDGARGIDLSALTGNRMINLDSEEEGIFLTSCAGGARVRCLFPAKRSEAEGYVCEIVLGGLQGGHSGAEIHRERGNANCLMARALWNLSNRLPIRLVSVKGGLADNAIPRETRAVVLVPKGCEVFERMEERPEDPTLFDEVLEDFGMEVQDELLTRDPGFTLRWSRNAAEGRIGNVAGDGRGNVNADGEVGFTLHWNGKAPEVQKVRAFSAEDTKRAAAALFALPGGVQAMSADMPGLVETSLNLGILETEEQGIDAKALPENTAVLAAELSVRSSVESAKNALIEKLKAIVTLAGGSSVVTGDYPGWQYRKDSPLREKMIRVYEETYGAKPRVEAIHAGLECGILGSKIADLDCVSIGPDMQDIHTTEETLSISSTKRVWDYLVRLLETRD